MNNGRYFIDLIRTTFQQVEVMITKITMKYSEVTSRKSSGADGDWFSRMGPKPLILTFYEQIIACERMCLMLFGSKETLVRNISDSIGTNENIEK